MRLIQPLQKLKAILGGSPTLQRTHRWLVQVLQQDSGGTRSDLRAGQPPRLLVLVVETTTLPLGTATTVPAPLVLSILTARSPWNCHWTWCPLSGQGTLRLCLLSLTSTQSPAQLCYVVSQLNGPQSWSVHGKDLDHCLPATALRGGLRLCHTCSCLDCR